MPDHTCMDEENDHVTRVQGGGAVKGFSRRDKSESREREKGKEKIKSKRIEKEKKEKRQTRKISRVLLISVAERSPSKEIRELFFTRGPVEFGNFQETCIENTSGFACMIHQHLGAASFDKPLPPPHLPTRINIPPKEFGKSCRTKPFQMCHLKKPKRFLANQLIWKAFPYFTRRRLDYD
ncbi:hypothetical protein CEXT_38901 [Caerostris extrusa]|uniref:Uncharacterized protein n=1 Tax=Caerostris extrusa TaxID=172846 RepID=A0AAV4P2J8_CAEEX|nr:hypothetical protein CEXT_38901 [Caerostris extrusa]